MTRYFCLGPKEEGVPSYHYSNCCQYVTAHTHTHSRTPFALSEKPFCKWLLRDGSLRAAEKHYWSMQPPCSEACSRTHMFTRTFPLLLHFTGRLKINAPLKGYVFRGQVYNWEWSQHLGLAKRRKRNAKKQWRNTQFIYPSATLQPS